ncbi:MAG: hypothetical protein LC122_11135 [Chitinophagales bacterium]|nr:hypothetical protein [Chitinophagales bacterium]
MKCLIIVILITLIACNNNDNKAIKQEDEGLKNSSLLGLWNVKYITETDFGLSDNDTLRGTFTDTLQNVSITFKQDSIIYFEDKAEPITNRYTYHKLNDSVLSVQNIVSKDSMKFYIHYLDTVRLLFTNIRYDKRRGEKYEVTLDCKKIKNIK